MADFRMPDMNGLEVVQQIKQINPEIPVVVITAFSDTKYAFKVMKEGAFETNIIRSALELKKENQSRDAKLLGISERHLRSGMQKLNIINTERH